MNAPTRAEQQVEAYLGCLRSALRAMPSSEADDIVTELRSHLADLAETDGAWNATEVAAALARLGDPVRLAEQYQLDRLATRAQSLRSPALLLSLVARWAARSLAGLWALTIASLGYLTALFALGCAILKPFYPHRIGLWAIPTSDGTTFQLGRVLAPLPGARELLGWSIVPIAVLVSVVCFALTTRYLLRCAADIRHFREKRVNPAN
jgi:hypothetical protein